MFDGVMERATWRSVGILGRTSSERCDAFGAASNLVRVSQELETKHGRSPAMRKAKSDGSEMDNVVLRRVLMPGVVVRRSGLRSSQARWKESGRRSKVGASDHFG